MRIIKIIFALSLFVCNGIVNAQNDTICQINPGDKNLYEPLFITQLNKYCDQKDANEIISLDGGTLWVNDTPYDLLDDIKFNRTYIFKKQTKKENILLKINRKNYTSIFYELNITSNNKIKQKKSGTLTISASFFLGSESDIDEKTEQMYFVSEYWAPENDEFFSIRIGQDSKTLRANLKFENEQFNKSLRLIRP